MKAMLALVFFSSLNNLFAITFDDVFTEVQKNNLMLKEAQQNRASVFKRPGTIWPAPELAFTEMKMQRSLEIGQMFPSREKLKVDSLVKKNGEKEADLNDELTIKKVKQEAFLLFLSIVKSQEEYFLFQYKKNQLELLLNKLRSGQVQGQEDHLQIMEVQSDLHELVINMELVKNEGLRMKSMLNLMMGKEITSSFDKFITPELKINDAVSDLSGNKELLKGVAAIGVMDADIAMKKSERLPEFNLKIKRNFSKTMEVESSNELMIGMTLPFIFFEQNQNSIASTILKKEAMIYGQANLLNDLHLQKENLKSEVDDIQKTLNFLKDNSLPLKERKFKLFQRYSLTDMKSLMSAKMGLDEFIMVKMKIIEKERDLKSAIYRYNELFQ